MGKCRRPCRLASSNAEIESQIKNSVTGEERMTRRAFTRSSVPVLEAVTRIILAGGFVVAVMLLAINMKQGLSMQQEKSSEKHIENVTEFKAKLEASCATISKDMSDLRACVSRCALAMNDIANGLQQIKSRGEDFVCKLETLRVPCWCPCCHWKAGCQ